MPNGAQRQQDDVPGEDPGRRPPAGQSGLRLEAACDQHQREPGEGGGQRRYPAARQLQEPVANAVPAHGRGADRARRIFRTRPVHERGPPRPAAPSAQGVPSPWRTRGDGIGRRGACWALSISLTGTALPRRGRSTIHRASGGTPPVGQPAPSDWRGRFRRRPSDRARRHGRRNATRRGSLGSVAGEYRRRVRGLVGDTEVVALRIHLCRVSSTMQARNCRAGLPVRARKAPCVPGWLRPVGARSCGPPGGVVGSGEAAAHGERHRPQDAGAERSPSRPGLGPSVSASASAGSVADSHDCRQHDGPGPEQHLAELRVTRGTWTDVGHVKSAIVPYATWYDEQRLYYGLGYCHPPRARKPARTTRSTTQSA